MRYEPDGWVLVATGINPEPYLTPFLCTLGGVGGGLKVESSMYWGSEWVGVQADQG